MLISSKNGRSLDNGLRLYNDDDTFTDILCAEIPTHSAEVFKASQQGIQSVRTLVVHSDEYEYQEKCLYDDICYRIYRYYPMEDGFTELYIGQRVGGAYSGG